MTATAIHPAPATAGPPYQVDDFAEVLYMGSSATVLVDAQLLSVARYGSDRWLVVGVVSAPREAFHLVPAGTAAEPSMSGAESGSRNDADPPSASLRPCPPPGGQRPDRT